MNTSIANIRKDYQLKSLEESTVKANPFEQFDIWWNDAVSSEIDEVNAFTLATCNKVGKPSARIVLLKDVTTDGFTFFTNYNSKKAAEIEDNNQAAICFFWKELERQIRIEGNIIKITEAESEAYFNSRPQGSKIGAWASPQSTIIDSRSILEDNIKSITDKYKDNIPKPPHWGGYILLPNYFEFWQGRSSRLHDRLCYFKNENSWAISRLAP